MDINESINYSGLTNVFMSIEGVDQEIGVIEEHPTSTGYFRAFAYDGSLLQSSENNYAFFNFAHAKEAVIAAYNSTQEFK
ncbi:hypothetical protein [Peribacillus sp. SCS-155]|uniref:hypothetical protein n=1 Tax=Peribacillus sedimenti TaxID=3115297 RepID=UPI0039057BD7